MCHITLEITFMKSSALFCPIFCLLTDEIWIALSCIYIIRLHYILFYQTIKLVII